MATLELIPGTMPAEQVGFAFPQSLTERYAPQTLDDFCGLDKPKSIMRKLIARPYQSAWMYHGESGTGKTSMGLAIARFVPAELHHVTAQSCDLAMIEHLWHVTHLVPHIVRENGEWLTVSHHLILIDEIDRASLAAQIALLSKLDPANFFPNTIVIGTTNDISNLETRFISRFRVLPFSSYGISQQLTALLARVWEAEAGGAKQPNFQRIVKENNNNARAALMALETELMAAA